MSGGVDSSVAAALLKEAGHEVLGLTMRLHRGGAGGWACGAPDPVESGRAAAAALGVPFEVAELEETFGRAVVDRFVDDYVAGLTPNPCVACNAELKFGWLLRRARAMGALLATGHYARVERRGERWALCPSPHGKDQSYFLYGLGQEALGEVLFPVGELPKGEVRRIAARHRLPATELPESQELCFVPEGSAAGFVALRAPERVRPGQVVSTSGEVLGQHQGVHAFTVGQRRGLGLGGGPPRFVVRLEAGAGRVVVGSAAEASRSRLAVEQARWVTGAPPSGAVAALVRVRHGHAGRAGRGDAGRGRGARRAGRGGAGGRAGSGGGLLPRRRGAGRWTDRGGGRVSAARSPRRPAGAARPPPRPGGAAGPARCPAGAGVAATSSWWGPAPRAVPPPRRPAGPRPACGWW